MGHIDLEVGNVEEYKRKNRKLAKCGGFIILRKGTLTRKKRDVFIYNDSINGKSFQDIAEDHGLSRERIRQICEDVKNNPDDYILTI